MTVNHDKLERAYLLLHTINQTGLNAGNLWMNTEYQALLRSFTPEEKVAWKATLEEAGDR